MNKIRILFFLSVCLLTAGCYYDTQQVLYGAASSAPCDTTHITYLAKIVPIINANCSSCHSSTTSPFGGGIVLDNYASFQQQASNGKLMGDINHSPGFNAMPLSGGVIDPCDIAKIQHWVDMGAQNN